MPLAKVSAELANIADRPGWSIVSSWREGAAAGATITKDGVILIMSRDRADNGDEVRLGHRVHPKLPFDLYRGPGFREILEGIGVAWNGQSYFTAIADNLAATRRYLSDPEVFRRGVMAQAKELKERYGRYESAPPEIARSRLFLLSRHPWLAAGELPSFETIISAYRPTGTEQLGESRRPPLWLVLFAVGIGLIVARWLQAAG